MGQSIVWAEPVLGLQFTQPDHCNTMTTPKISQLITAGLQHCQK